MIIDSNQFIKILFQISKVMHKLVYTAKTKDLSPPFFC